MRRGLACMAGSSSCWQTGRARISSHAASLPPALHPTPCSPSSGDAHLRPARPLRLHAACRHAGRPQRQGAVGAGGLVCSRGVLLGMPAGSGAGAPRAQPQLAAPPASTQCKHTTGGRVCGRGLRLPVLRGRERYPKRALRRAALRRAALCADDACSAAAGERGCRRCRPARFRPPPSVPSPALLLLLSPVHPRQVLGMVLKVGEANLEAMALLDGGHTSKFGHPSPSPVRLLARPRLPACLRPALPALPVRLSSTSHRFQLPPSLSSPQLPTGPPGAPQGQGDPGQRARPGGEGPPPLSPLLLCCCGCGCSAARLLAYHCCPRVLHASAADTPAPTTHPLHHALPPSFNRTCTSCWSRRRARASTCTRTARCEWEWPAD